MAGATTNLKLIKPVEGEKYDVDVLNGNSEIVDVAYDKLPKGLLYYKQVPAATPFISGWMTIDTTDAINLVKDRWYSVQYEANTASAGIHNALAIVCKKDVVGEMAQDKGVIISLNKTVWTAELADSGKHSGTLDFTFKAPATETIMFKITSTRAAGTSNTRMDQRIIAVYDRGLGGVLGA